MSGYYEIGWHSSDVESVHVSFVLDGASEDLFDVSLYSTDEGNPHDGAFIESKEALELLVARANSAIPKRDW
jgi:hypothetical protein